MPLEKSTMIALLIEAAVFLIPLITLFVKVGKYAEKIETLEKRIDRLDGIESKLNAIDAKVDLLIQGKIKNEK